MGRPNRTLAERWQALKGAVTSGVRRIMLPGCCRQVGCNCADIGARCICGHHEHEGSEEISMPTFHVPLGNDPIQRPCCRTLGCSHEAGCNCNPACF